jgi:hypothetical protein
MYFLARIEETGFSIWLRESDWGFFTALTFHSLALALVVGINLAINLRVLGFARLVPINLMNRFLPIMGIGFVVVVISGVLLLIAYPAKALTNVVFYLKIAAIIAALLLTSHFNKTLMQQPGEGLARITSKQKKLAATALVLWIISVTAGRFLAYTHTVLLASRFY